MSTEKPTATVHLTSKSRKFINAQQEIYGLSASRIVNDALECYRLSLQSKPQQGSGGAK